MKLVIMQPTYLPWLGYFDLIDQSDLFVFLDTVQFEKQSWQQRNRIKTHQGPQWLTVPVLQSLHQKIMETRINNTTDWRRKHWLSLSSSYQKAPHWKSFASQLQTIYERPWEMLVDLNIHIIQTSCEWMGIKPKFKRASQLGLLQGTKTELLISICRACQADTYLSPIGSLDYLKTDTLFSQNKISLLFHQYTHPSYLQLNSQFMPYISVIDLIMNTGPQSAEIIRSGRQIPRPLHDSELMI